MGFMYPRTVQISRPHINAGVGDQGYSAERGAVDETVLFTGVPCSIQKDRQGQHNPVNLPTDAAYKPIWKVFVPKSAAALGSIMTNDIVTDDLGQRYQVFDNWWDSLGFQLGCIILEP